MNKSQLVTIISENADLTKTASGRALDAALDAITKSLANGEEVAIAGFGTFKTSLRKSRIGRNPQSGKQIQIPASTLPQWKAGKRVKDACN